MHYNTYVNARLHYIPRLYTYITYVAIYVCTHTCIIIILLISNKRKLQCYNSHVTFMNVVEQSNELLTHSVV